MSHHTQTDKGNLIKIALFAAILLAIAIFHLIFHFDGLTHPTGIDQAQAGREIARGHGLSTQVIRPLAVHQLIQEGKPVHFDKTPETYHAPLNLLVYAAVIKITGGDVAEKYTMNENDRVYKLDRIIAIVCTVFFIAAICINYLLVSRIFDRKIGAMVAILMMATEYLWKLTQTGQPQMLMLALFSAAAYMMWRAIEQQEANKNPFIPALISGVFFGLLALAHWITIWIFIGYLIFAAYYFRPRGAVALSLVALLILFIIAPLLYYAKHSDGVLGTAFYSLHGGSWESEELVMRSFANPSFDIRGLVIRILQTTLLQAGNIHNYLGGLIIAPAFFLALLHPFKKSSIATFRWNILLMWIFASIGMATYGIGDSNQDPNQIHILFMPIMTAYALAMMSIIWSRVPISQAGGMLGNLHFVLITLITVSPMLLTVRETAQKRDGITANSSNVISLNKTLASITQKNDLIVTDQPSAVAWYADRRAIWMPINYAELEKIEEIASNNHTPITGLHVSSATHGKQSILDALMKNGNLTPLAYIDWISYFQTVPATVMLEKNKIINALIDPSTGRYPHFTALLAFPRSSSYFAKEAPEGK